MRTRVRTSVGIKNHRHELHFGDVLWVERNIVALQSPGGLQTGRPAELKVELSHTGDWLIADSVVLKTELDSESGMTRAICRMHSLTAVEQDRLDEFVRHTVRNRRKPETHVSSNISAYGQLPKDVDTNAIPIRDPNVSLSEDGRRVTVRWHNIRSYRRDWAMHLSRGRLPTVGKTPNRAAFMMCLILPDGFVTTFPAEISDQSESSWTARFLLPFTPRKRMEALAEDRRSKVAGER